MATLAEVGEHVTSGLRRQVEALVSAIEDGGADFLEIARRADRVGEAADSIADLYTDLDRRLTQGPDTESSGGEEPVTEEVTKEELLERARELNVPGRSSMSKEALAEAVQEEESQTKEDLLERAKEAGIEGRSSMSKDELREALTAAGG